VQVWYPAQNQAGSVEATIYDYGVIGHAIRQAKPDANDAPYPIVLYAHGLYGSRVVASDITEHLASWGFFVIAIDYADNWSTLEDGIPYISLMISRPRDVSWQLDYAEALTSRSGEMQGILDTDRVAIIGHSFGGYTALIAGGSRLDLGWFGRLASSHPEACVLPVIAGGGDWCSDILDFQRQLADLAGLEGVPEGLWPSWGDPRIDALVSLAGDAEHFGPEGLRDVNIPSMFVSGSSDMFNLPEFNTYQPFDYVGSTQKSMVILEGADHHVFHDQCSAMPSWVLDVGIYWYCSDPVWDMDRAHDLINHFTTAFLLDVLKGDKEAHAALAPDAVSFPGIEYTAEGF
jgi:predicted dienelactone hydrolase